MNRKEMAAKAKAIKAAQETNTKEEIKMSKVKINGKEYEAKYKVGNIPYTNVPDGLMDFTITNIQYTGEAVCLTGVINPYRLPEKAAHFVYTAKGKTAQMVMSNIMEQLDDVFADVYKAQKEYWYTMRRFDPELPAPVYTTPIKNMLLNQTFTVEVKHYKGFLQLDFATYRFQSKIDAANRLGRDFNVENPNEPIPTPTNQPAPKGTTKKAAKKATTTRKEVK